MQLLVDIFFQCVVLYSGFLSYIIINFIIGDKSNKTTLNLRSILKCVRSYDFLVAQTMSGMESLNVSVNLKKRLVIQYNSTESSANSGIDEAMARKFLFLVSCT